MAEKKKRFKDLQPVIFRRKGENQALKYTSSGSIGDFSDYEIIHNGDPFYVIDEDSLRMERYILKKIKSVNTWCALKKGQDRQLIPTYLGFLQEKEEPINNKLFRDFKVINSSLKQGNSMQLPYPSL